MSGKWSRDRRRYFTTAVRQRREREASPTPVPQRITMALDIRGLYGPEVDHACGVEEPTVDLWETGEIVPTAGQVAALSALTGFPVAFFYVRPVPPIGPMWLCGEDGCQALDDRPAAPVLPLRRGGV